MAVMLEPYGGGKTRHRCPKCGRSREFSRYIDEKGEYISEDVGRCNKEDSCGYHKKPKDHFIENPRSEWSREWRHQPKVPDKPTDYLPHELMTQTMKGYEQNNFYLFLQNLIGEVSAKHQMKKYNVGTSRHWQGSTVFWQVDTTCRLRQLKIMLYNPHTGKRVKSDISAMKWDYISNQYREDIGGQDKSLIYGKYIQGGKFKNSNLQQCLFGEHLLKTLKRVALVESEKTAIIASHYFPDLTWLATGGTNGAGFTKPNVCKVLHGREVILFPDLGQFEKWSVKAKELQRVISCKIVVSDLLENHAGQIEREKGYDLADFLVANNTPQCDNIAPEIQLADDVSRNAISQDQGKWMPLEGFEGF